MPIQPLNSLLYRQGHQYGSSLLEVMVALFVLGVGLLGVLALQLQSGKYNQSAYYYTQAAFLANEIAESLRSNPSVKNSYSLLIADATPTASVDCSSASVNCTAGELRDWNLNKWRNNVAANLPSGKSSIVSDGTFFTITVQFDDARVSSSGAQDLHEYVLVTKV